MNTTPSNFAKAWYSVIADKPEEKWSKTSKDMLSYLYTQGKFSWIPEILAQAEKTNKLIIGKEEVKVKVARDFPEDFIKKIVKKLLRHDNFSLAITKDSGIIAGMLIETDSRRWDLTVKGTIAQLKKTLLEKI